ncbi:hypothetical protein ACQP06_16570 [Nocardia sp. CA-136227]|uniref:hypothetical protein n=1 Tax=Nocardia sp. CA-136227 TaxID=3239979 RepID=UPI003D96DFE2
MKPVICTATVVWRHRYRDAALLEIDTSLNPRPIMWGRFACSDDAQCESIGFPRFAHYDGRRHTVVVSGPVKPFTMGPKSTYALEIAVAPTSGKPDPETDGAEQETHEAEPAWRGLSGAAVICANHVIGLLAKDDELFDNHMIYAVRVSQLFTDAVFVEHLRQSSGWTPVMVPIEFSRIIQRRPHPLTQGGPASLLRAATEAVRFIEKGSQLEELAHWRDAGGPQLSICLVTAPAGEGKTRLGREFLQRSDEAGFATGFVEAAISIQQHWATLSRSVLPLVLVSDYAESRPGDLLELVKASMMDPPQRRVCLLLLARSKGSWWGHLDSVGGTIVHGHVLLEPLGNAMEARMTAYCQAVSDLGRRLAERHSDPRYRHAAERLTADPPDLSDTSYTNALSLQIKAYLDLRDAVEDGLAGRTAEPDDPDTEFVRHEQSYLEQVARRKGLYGKDIISPRVDNFDRDVEVKKVLDTLLCATILLNPVDDDAAVRIIQRSVPGQHNEDVLSWMREVYPPTGEGTDTIGRVEPDRIAEFLVGEMLSADKDLTALIGGWVDTEQTAHHMLLVLARTATHAKFQAVIDPQISDLIVEYPSFFAEPAKQLVKTAQRAAPIVQGIKRLPVPTRRPAPVDLSYGRRQLPILFPAPRPAGPAVGNDPHGREN